MRQLLDPRVPGAAVLGHNESVPGLDAEPLALVLPPQAEEVLAA